MTSTITYPRSWFWIKIFSVCAEEKLPISPDYIFLVLLKTLTWPNGLHYDTGNKITAKQGIPLQCKQPVKVIFYEVATCKVLSQSSKQNVFVKHRFPSMAAK